jgi:hypothetical protein
MKKHFLVYSAIINRIILGICLLLVINSRSNAQIIQAEYFFDNDPGAGSGNALLAQDGNLDNAIEGLFKNGINTGSLSVGVHTFNVRVKDANNVWGPVFKTLIHVSNTLTVRSLNVIQAEIFWDSDPGQGNGTPLVAFDGNFDSALETVSQTVSVPTNGAHVLHIRIKDAANNWGPTFKYVVNVINPLTIRNARISQAELYWDTDPGQGNGTPLLAFDGNFNDAIEVAVANTSQPSVGNHILNVRVKDANNNWGPVFRTVVQVTTPFNFRTIKIDLAELFWDTDPGAGNGTPMLAFDGNFNDAIETVFKNITPPALGNHLLHIRVKDGIGTWGPTFRYVINITNPLTLRTIKVTQGEFFFDTDPGQGAGFPLVALDGNFDNAIEALNQNWSFLPDTGFHVLNVRAKDANNTWGPVFRTVLRVLPCVNQPTVSITPNTTQQICPGDTVIFTAQTGFTSYTWFRGGTIVGTGQTFVADTMGHYRVFAIDSSGCGAFSAFTQVNQIPVNVNITASGPLTFCQGGTVTLNAGNGFNSYLWSTGANTQNLTVASSGQYSVIVTSGQCFGYDTVNVVVNPLPPTPVISSSGPTVFCQGGSVYLIASSPTNNYYWNTYQTTDSILVTNAGTYTVTVTDNNGCSKSNSVNVNIYPAPISSHSGTTTICSGDSAQLFVNGGVSYQWTPLIGISNPTISNPYVFPSTSTQYKVVVTGIGGCVDSTFIDVIVNPKPTVSASATIPSCEGQSLMLFASPNGATSYMWTGPGGYISYLQNPVITNTSLLNNGTYIVTAANTGGCFAQDTIIVSGIKPSPVVSLNGNFNLCQGDTLVFNLLPSGLSYQWTGPNGFTSNLQNPQINNITTADAGNYLVVVTNSNNCSVSVQATVNVGTQPTLSFSGTNHVCQGDLISINALPNGLANYHWSGPNGFNSNTQNILLSNAQLTNTGWYVLTAGSGSNCSSKDSVYITVNSNPVAQVLNATNTYCAGDSIRFLAAPNGMQSYIWQGPNSYTSTQQNPLIPYLQTYQSGNYVLIVTDYNGCTSSTSFNLTVNPTPLAEATTNAPYVCQGDSLFLFANPSGMTYSWTSNTGFTSTLQNPSIDSAVVANSGTYFVTVTNSFGCSATAQTDVFVSAHPNISFVNNNVFCEGENLQLFATPSGMTSYLWTGPNNFSSPLNNPSIPQVTAAAQGYYVLNIMNNYGCTDVDSIYIQIFPKPDVTASGNGTLCEGDSLVLNASTAGFASYQWSGPNNFTSNLQNPIIHSVTELNEGSYVVTAINSFGCSDNDIFYVSVNQGPAVNVSYTSQICAGDSIKFFTTPSGMTYSWSGPNGFSASTQNVIIPSAQINNSGTYTLFTNNGLCNSTKSITVMVKALPNVTISQFGTVLNAVQNDATYQWLTCNDTVFTPIIGATGQTFTATQNGNYAVLVVYDGCVDTSSCFSVNGIGMDEKNISKRWQVYPIPNNGQFFIEALPGMDFDLMDVTGKLISTYKIQNKLEVIQTNLPTGMYFIREKASGTMQKLIIE